MGVWGVAAVGDDDIRYNDEYTACGPPAVFGYVLAAKSNARPARILCLLLDIQHSALLY